MNAAHELIMDRRLQCTHLHRLTLHFILYHYISLHFTSFHFILYYIILYFSIINQHVSLHTCLADLLIGGDSRILTHNPSTFQKCAFAIAIAVAIGPSIIIHLYTNGTITFQHTPHSMDYIHICQCKEYQI